MRWRERWWRRAEEREAAEAISEDHVNADRQGVGIASLFPAIQVGYIVSRVNGQPTEDIPFAEIQQFLDEARPPHTLEFRRYDYRRNMVTGGWHSLQHLREVGKYVEDPRIGRNIFVGAACKNDLVELNQALDRGEDVNCIDSTQCTGMHHAAANGHAAIVRMLIADGCDQDAPNHVGVKPLQRAACVTGDVARALQNVAATSFLLTIGLMLHASRAGVRLGGDLAERIARAANLDVRLARSEVDYDPAVVLGCRIRVMLADDLAGSHHLATLDGMIIEDVVPLLHRLQVVARLVIAHAVPTGHLVGGITQVADAEVVRFGLEEPSSHESLDCLESAI